MFKKRATIAITFFGFVLINISTISAQCAMCKTVVSSNKASGGSIGNELNTGILYLMAIPYLMLSVMAIYVFRKQIVQKFPSLKSILKVE